MRCERCQGRGRVLLRTETSEQGYDRLVRRGDHAAVANAPPCPDCHGSGIADCCGGPVCDVPERD